MLIPHFLSLFFYSSSDLIDIVHSAGSSVALFLVSYVAGFYGAASPWGSDVLVAALVCYFIIIGTTNFTYAHVHAHNDNELT